MNVGIKQALLASAALGCAALAVAGCASNPDYRYQRDAGNVSHVAPTLAPAGSTTVVQGQPPATVVVPQSPYYSTPPATTLGGTVIAPGNPMPTSIAVPGDVDFLARASQFNATEQGLSRVAYQRAGTEAVRAFARQMLESQRHMADTLDAIALRHNISLAWTPNPAGSDAISRISSLSGRELDRAYLDQVIADQQAAAELFQQESDAARDSTLRSTAGSDAISLRQLADQAYRVRREID